MYSQNISTEKSFSYTGQGFGLICLSIVDCQCIAIVYIIYERQKAIAKFQATADKQNITNNIMTYPETLKAISIHAPHAYAICMGIKETEYRSRPTDRRGWILIHASQSKASDDFFAEYGIDPNICRGAIIGAAFLTNCIWDSHNQCYAYQLEEAILFDEPFEGIKGCQAIFWGANTSDKQAAFAEAWNTIELYEKLVDNPWEEAEPKSKDNRKQALDDISQEAIEVTGYKVELVDDSYGDWENLTYDVFDDMALEFLFQIYRTTDGWKTGFTRQIHETPQEAIAIARERAIERINRSLKLEVRPITIQEPDGYGDAFIVRNKENGSHYVVRPEHPDANARCECPDAIYRGVECKHQLAVRESLEYAAPSWKRQAAETCERMLDGEQLIIDTATGEAVLKYESDTRFGVNYLCTNRGGGASTKLIMSQQEFEKYVSDLYNPRVIEAFGSANPRFLIPNPQPPTPNSQLPNIQFISPDGFYEWEAIADNGDTVATISYDSEHLTEPYVIAVERQIIHRTNTQSKAENYIIWHHKNASLPIIEKEIPEPCTIEDCDFRDEKGQQYTFRINGQMIGYIWHFESEDWDNHEEYWTNSNGKKYDDWRDCGLALARVTRNDLYEEYQLLAA